MSEINVLSDNLKGGNKLEKMASLKGNDLGEHSDKASVFATLLSGSIKQISNSKGQSSKVGQDSEDKQITSDSTQNTSNSNDFGSLLGFGNFVLPLLVQPLLQSGFPAGKEANSGDVMSQGTGGLLTVDSPGAQGQGGSTLTPSLSTSDEVSLVSGGALTTTGMTLSKSQGNIPVITELDNYRQVIEELLQALSGVIKDHSSSGNSLKSDGSGGLSQDMAKIVQGWATLNNFVTEEDQATGSGLGGQPSLNAENENTAAGNGLLTKSQLIKMIDQLKAASDDSAVPVLGEADMDLNSSGIKDLSKDLAKMIRGWIKEVDPTPDSLTERGNLGTSTLGSSGKTSSPIEALNEVTGQGVVETKPLQAEGSSTETKVTRTPLSNFPVEQQNKTNSDISSTLKGSDRVVNAQRNVENSSFENMASKEEMSNGKPLNVKEIPKEVQNQIQDPNLDSVNSVVGTSTILTTNVADGKTAGIPVWEQISNVWREQVPNRHQELKELDIQLHPADLGKIQISLRWENGLVHLQLHASEASTGQILQTQFSDLRHSLSDQGVNCGTLQMGQNGEQQQNSRGHEQRTFQPKIPAQENEDLTIEKPSIFLQEKDGSNRINVTA